MGSGTPLSEVWSGIDAIGDDPRMVIMWAVAAAFLYVGIAWKKEPRLLVPIAMGIMLANLPMGILTREASGDTPAGLMTLLQDAGIDTNILPLLAFLGLGAAVDFEAMLANPKTILLGAGAQVGVFIALICAVLLGMFGAFDINLADAAAIGIVGGADGPTAAFVATRMHHIAQEFINPSAISLVGAATVAVYSYIALVPIIQPPIIRFFTTQNERRIRMDYSAKPVSKRTKILFPIITTLIVGVLVPDAIGLVGMLMLGNLMRESGVVPRLVTGVDNLLNIVVVLLGLAIGATMAGSVFLQFETLAIFVLGLVGFVTATISGILLAKLMNLVTKSPVNPMIGAAGVSAVPISARVVQEMGRAEDPQNFLLMHAMGPNVAGVIGTAVVAGVLINIVPTLL